MPPPRLNSGRPRGRIIQEGEEFRPILGMNELVDRASDQGFWAVSEDPLDRGTLAFTAERLATRSARIISTFLVPAFGIRAALPAPGQIRGSRSKQPGVPHLHARHRQ